MRYSGIKKVDVANGPGVRVSLFVSGCRMNCKNCFNREAQSFQYGIPYTKETEDEIIEVLSQSYISGLSLLGGDPMERENQPDIANLVEKAKEQFPDKEIWLWTGRIYPDEFKEGSSMYIDNVTNRIFKNVDVVIDGPFIQDLFSRTLKYRGSSNQRILKLDENGEVIGCLED